MNKETIERKFDLVKSALKYSYHVSCLSPCTIKLPLKLVYITILKSAIQDMEKDETMTSASKLFIKGKMPFT